MWCLVGQPEEYRKGCGDAVSWQLKGETSKTQKVSKNSINAKEK